MTFLVELYVASNGRCPVAEYMRKQPEHFRARFYNLLERIGEKGTTGLNIKPLIKEKNKIYEIKADDMRILFFYHEGNVVVVTSAFQKKTGKTPKEEKDKAVRYQNEYLWRTKIKK